MIHSSLNSRSTKAVIPAAGMGTRFLPATKAMPKEMLPVVDEPAIQYVVAEAKAAGLDDVLMITGRSKRALEDHFDRVPALEHTLELKGDFAKLEKVQKATNLGNIHFVRQNDALGLGHAVLCAKQHVGHEPFAVLLGDDLIDERENLLDLMLDVQQEKGGSVIALIEVPQESISSYGRCWPRARETASGFTRSSSAASVTTPGTSSATSRPSSSCRVPARTWARPCVRGSRISPRNSPSSRTLASERNARQLTRICVEFSLMAALAHFICRWVSGWQRWARASRSRCWMPWAAWASISQSAETPQAWM